MTLYFGICYDEADPESSDIAAKERDNLASILRPLGSTRIITRPNLIVIHTDIVESISECIVESGAEGGGDDFTIVNGDITKHGHEISFRETVELYHKDISREDFDALCAYEGMYSSIHYTSKTNQCRVTTGKLGIRPVYIARLGGIVVFANTFWLIDRCSVLQKCSDIQALAEDYYFFGSLEDRTAYRTVQRLEPGTVAVIQDLEVTKHRYYRLTGRPPADGRPLEEAIAEAFKMAVRERQRNRPVAYSALSSGLDSRSIVGVLRDQGVEVVTACFGYEGELDLELSSRFAAVAGVEHHGIATEALYRPNWSMLMRNTFTDIQAGSTKLPPDTSMYWSGDDGSISLGYVYMRKDFLRKLARDGVAGAFEASGLVSDRLPRRLFASGMGDLFAGLASQGLTTCLENIPIADMRWRWYVFVHENRIHRMLDEHFETIHEHKLEMIAPFLDSRLFELVMSGDCERDCEHELYHRVMEHLPASISSVAWQAYRGHRPCPHPVDTEKSQWDSWGAGKSKRRHYKELFMRYGEALLSGDAFPEMIFNKNTFRLYYYAYKFLNRDCEYIIYALHRIRNASRDASF